MNFDELFCDELFCKKVHHQFRAQLVCFLMQKSSSQKSSSKFTTKKFIKVHHPAGRALWQMVPFRGGVPACFAELCCQISRIPTFQIFRKLEVLNPTMPFGLMVPCSAPCFFGDSWTRAAQNAGLRKTQNVPRAKTGFWVMFPHASGLITWGPVSPS